MIANPFPSVWHTMADNGAALDYPTIDYINKELNTQRHQNRVINNDDVGDIFFYYWKPLLAKHEWSQKRFWVGNEIAESFKSRF